MIFPTQGRGVSTTFASIAAAGTNQGNATAITTTDVVVTGANGTVGVILPADSAAFTIILHTAGGSGALKVYPPSGSTLNSAAANASMNVAPNTTRIFRCLRSTVWVATLD